MSTDIIKRIQEYILEHGIVSKYPCASIQDVINTEDKFGFKFPSVLIRFYTEVANGGVGPGYGLIGMQNGFKSDYGDIFDSTQASRISINHTGKVWPKSLVTFCEWGCNMYSCVDVRNNDVYLFKDMALNLQKFSLEDFFDGWICGIDLFEDDGEHNTAHVKAINPFNGKPI